MGINSQCNSRECHGWLTALDLSTIVNTCNVILLEQSFDISCQTSISMVSITKRKCSTRKKFSVRHWKTTHWVGSASEVLCKMCNRQANLILARCSLAWRLCTLICFLFFIDVCIDHSPVWPHWIVRSRFVNPHSFVNPHIFPQFTDTFMDLPDCTCSPRRASLEW